MTDAPTQLRIWMATHRVTSKVLAAQLNCGSDTVCDWRRGKTRPLPVYRSTLETITAGAVPASAWGDE